ncbi:Ktr system potassium uptake protein B [Symmachiella dynata]|nr:Ktr system potassium uptake protein B [Symmachiella dynata]
MTKKGVGVGLLFQPRLLDFPTRNAPYEMSTEIPPPNIPLAVARQRIRRSSRVLAAERVMQVVGVVSIVLHRSSRQWESMTDLPLGIATLVIMSVFAVGLGLRYYWAVSHKSFVAENRVSLGVVGLWFLGVLITLIFGGGSEGRFGTINNISEAAIFLRTGVGFVILVRWISSGGRNPAFILVASFLVLVAVGTILLMLPRARAEVGQGGAPFHVALFTATSASCVTGLILVDTGTYWSATGQTIILCLFQIGGLGIMTCGSLFALVSARRMQVRETAFLADMLETENTGALRKLMTSIVLFTATAELIGAASLWGLWPELPWHERAFHSLFHSVSAFCNAGFALMPDSFSSMQTRWQIWAAVPALIIVGGLGFAAMADLGRVFRWRITNRTRAGSVNVPHGRMRLGNTSWLVGVTTLGLLAWGTCGFYLLESAALMQDLTVAEQASASWFQSVTFRTAGFNTVDLADLQPGTKFFGIMMMFVGASPGSTGGGIKTVSFALSILAVVALLRGREQIELRGRTIPQSIVKRSLMIVAMGIFCVLTTTLLIVVIENQPEYFLDHLFEATSAFATVGVSTIDTASLRIPSQFVIILTMFVGRVGPLTLIVGLAGSGDNGRYSYPEERVMLG